MEQLPNDNHPKKKKILGYAITLVVGLAFAFIIMLSKGIFKKESSIEIFHILTDSFFVPGVCIFGFGLLVVASNGGTFDMMTYGLIKFFSFFKRDLKSEKYKTFQEYRLARHETSSEFLHLVIVGLFLIALSLIFLACYYNVK